MITYTELKKACNNVVKKLGIKIYGIEVIDGYKKPSFFTELVPGNAQYDTKNFSHNSCSYMITYFQEKPNEIDMLEKIDTLRELFGMKVLVGDRKINVTGFTFGFTGTNNNIPQITVSLEWYENNVTEPTEELIKNVDLKVKKE